MNGGETFLIIEKQALVQVDLYQSIEEIRPNACILRARSLDEAGSLLDGVERLTGAIVGAGASALKQSGIGRRIEALGAWIICLNGSRSDEIVAEGWHPLAEPFSADDAQRLITSLLDQSASAPAAD